MCEWAHANTHTHTHRVFALVYPWKLTELEVELQKTKSTQQQKNVGEAVDVGAHQMRDLKIFLENGRVDRRESCSLESLWLTKWLRGLESQRPVCLKSGEEVRSAEDCGRPLLALILSTEHRELGFHPYAPNLILFCKGSEWLARQKLRCVVGGQPLDHQV